MCEVRESKAFGLKATRVNILDLCLSCTGFGVSRSMANIYDISILSHRIKGLGFSIEVQGSGLSLFRR